MDLTDLGSSVMWEVEIVYSYTYSGMTNTAREFIEIPPEKFSHFNIHWLRLQSNEGALHVFIEIF